jgi:acyl-CoA synthetase (AMP-forming)/AMP-acid ligase II
VAEAVALGMPDERLGQAVCLIVRGSRTTMRAQGGAQARLAELHAAAGDPLGRAMPINPNGKIDRTALQQKLAA